MNGRTDMLLRFAAILVPLALLLSAGSTIGSLAANRAAEQAANGLAVEVEARLVESCERANESRATTREMMRAGDVAAAEALIDVVGTDPEVQPLVEQFRAELATGLDRIVTEHAAEDRDCETEAAERASAG